MFVVMYLNRANHVIGVYKLSLGGITGTIADPRLILATALKVAASSIILAHNHPSSNLKPSKADELLTNKIKQGALFMDIQVSDHLILSSSEGYYSFADEGMI
jgi:DNA repair protein RadC